MLTLEQLKGKALEKLASSGIPLEMMQFFDVADSATIKARQPNYEKRGSVIIPYWTVDKKQTGFERIRYLEEADGWKVEKSLRYCQPGGDALIEVYLPPVLDWEGILKDAAMPIIITEGEFKAMAASCAGLPTMGLGGVDSWRAAKRGIDLLPTLKATTWRDRMVYIAYDSDSAMNPDVARASKQLAERLAQSGAKVSIARLPAGPDGEKQGLDDLLVRLGRDDFLEEMLRIRSEAEPTDESVAMWDMNERFVFLRALGGVVIRRDTGDILQTDGFSKSFGNEYFNEITYEQDPETKKLVVKKRKKVEKASHWLKWEGRPSLEKLTFEPGSPRVTGSAWNTWEGWPFEPKEGDVGPWNWLMGHAFGEAIEERKWFEQWCAYPIQNPGAKMYTAVMMWSPVHGCGKSLIGYLLRALYGRHGKKIGNQELGRDFNSWAEDSQFVFGDEIIGKEQRAYADMLKDMITGHSVVINKKFLQEYELPSRSNFYFTSNHPNALQVEDADRRYGIFRFRGAKLDRSFYSPHDYWLKHDKEKLGLRALLHYMLHVDLTGFDPLGAAPYTGAKEEMIRLSKSDIGLWVYELRYNPEIALAALGPKVANKADLFTSRQLLCAYDTEGKGKVTVGGIARELSQAGSGFPMAYHSSPITVGASKDRYYIVRNPEKWLSASHQECANHIKEMFGEGKAVDKEVKF